MLAAAGSASARAQADNSLLPIHSAAFVETAAPAEVANQSVDLYDGGIKLPPQIEDFKAYGELAWSVMNWIFDQHEEPQPSLWVIRERLESLNGQLVTLTRQATEQRIRSDKQYAELQAQFITEQYSAVQTALAWAAEFPEDSHNAALEVQRVADALMANGHQVEGFYIFSDYPNADRFDPRLATPTFVAAVSAWIAIRTAGGLDVNRDLLHAYAMHLDWLADMTSLSVNCFDQQAIEPRVACGGRCEEDWCEQSRSCTDTISRGNDFQILSAWNVRNSPSSCPYSHAQNWDYGWSLGDQRYGFQNLFSVAGAWLDL
jgi:hypothetical protein